MAFQLKRADVTPGFLQAIAGPFHPVVMVYVDWPGDPVWAHSGIGTIQWDGASWHGVMPFGRVDLPEEMGGMASSRAALTLVGLAPDALEPVQQVHVRNRPGRVLVGAVDAPAGRFLVAPPVELFAGYVDAGRFTIEEVGAGDQPDLRHGIRLDLGVGPSARAGGSVYHSAEDQATAHPGDTAGRHLIRIEAILEGQTWPSTV